MASHEFKHESLQDAQSIAKYLKALIVGLESGELQFKNDEAELQLQPRGLLELELRARRKGGRGKLQLKLAWRETPRKSSAGGLQLSSGTES